MSNENPSPAQRRANRRKKQGKLTGEFEFEFEFPTNVQSLDDYYNLSSTQDEIDQIISQYTHLNDQAHTAFLRKTKLDRKDLSFLFLAVGLQCVRQYFLTAFKERVDHEHTKDADKAKEEHIHDKTKNGENNTNTQGGYYYKDLDGIIFDGVSYDVTKGSPDFDLNIGGASHRYKTLGHDPLLGWVFGPMNIMTNTLSTHNFQSFHIRDSKIYSRAKAGKILTSCRTRMKDEPVAIAAAVAKQAIHYNSDVYTSTSLPIPIIQTISPDLAQGLMKYGLDMANIQTIGKQAGYSILINMIISMVHRMFYNPAKDGEEKLYEVRTRKILLYSNLIATCSNVLVVALTHDLKKLDIGGMIVTIYRIVADEKFIREVMYDFIDSEVCNFYDKELAETNKIFDALLKESRTEV